MIIGELRLVDYKIQTLQHLSKENDKDTIEKHQLETMGVKVELNERLYLSYRYGKYVEPVKDLIMGNVPLTYKVYFQIIAGQISPDEWKQLPIEDVLY